jgi:hypothetical protein
MRTFQAVIDALGGPACYARGIIEIDGKLGMTVQYAPHLRRRNSIPPKFWPATVKLAKARGLAGVTHETLAAIYAAERTKRAKRA